MRQRATALLITTLALLLAVGQPAFAQGGGPAVTDQGDNVSLVDGSKGPLPSLLPAEDAQRIAALQSAARKATLPVSSPVSPDDQSVLITGPRGPVIMNIRDGSSVPALPPAGLAELLSNFFWLDGETLGVYAVSAKGEYWLVGLDRHTGLGRVAGAIPASAGLPVYASPDGRKRKAI